MNREQRRKVEKDAKAKGISKQLTKLYLDMNKNGFEKPVEPNEIHDGDKVQINIERVKTHLWLIRRKAGRYHKRHACA